MKSKTKAQAMFDSMKAGRLYRQSELQKEWPNASHDLKALADAGEIRKALAGFYYKPKKNKYGFVAPEDKELVEAFLKDDNFLLVNTNDYTSLVSGLTQLSMGYKVLNQRRHGKFKLAGFPFDFRVRRNFPKKVTKEFLLLDLLDNVEQLEDGRSLKEEVKNKLKEFDSKQLLKMASLYANRTTERFLQRELAS